MEYPIKIKTTAKFIDELIGCEYGRYEDAEQAREAGDIEAIEANEYEVVAVDFLERHKTIIEVQNDAEITELYYALAGGTIGLYMCPTANTILDKIRPRVQETSPDTVKRWPYQNCM